MVEKRSMRTILSWGGWLGLALLAMACLILAFSPTDALWWPIRAAGVVAFLLVPVTLLLPPSPSLLHVHRLVGALAILAMLAHILLAAALEPSLWRWLSPFMPIEIILGLVAAICLLATLWVQRSRNLRASMGPPRTLLVHRIAGFAVCFAVVAHVVLIAGMETAIILLAGIGMAAIVAFALVKERRVLPIIAIPIVLSGLAAFTVEPLSGIRLEGLRSSPVDHARFDHADHTNFTCVSCHHNYVDKTGTETCTTCHKKISTTEWLRVDRMFHTFCTDCHRREAATGRKSGPIDHCSGCHGT